MKFALVLALAACGPELRADPLTLQLEPALTTDSKTCHVTARPLAGVEARLEYTVTGWVVTCAATIGDRQAFNTRLDGAACWVVLDFDGVPNGGGFSFVPEPGGAFARYNPDAETRGFGGWHMECDPVTGAAR